MVIKTKDMPTVAGAQSAAVVPPQPLVPVRVLLQFLLPGSPDPMPGDEIELPRPLAHELAMYHKVELLPAVADQPPGPADASVAAPATTDPSTPPELFAASPAAPARGKSGA
jgi:hypothetical protein